MARIKDYNNREHSRSIGANLRKNWRGVLIIAGITFILAVIVSLATEFFIRSVTSLIFAFCLLILIILIGVLFDAIGVAAAAAEEPPFHAKAADQVQGASESVHLIRRADRVASFCNDVVGDVSGTISGAIGATIALRLIRLNPSWSVLAVAVIMAGLIAAATVGGKAIGKTFAINQANDIMFGVGRFLAWFSSITGWSIVTKTKKAQKRKTR